MLSFNGGQPEKGMVSPPGSERTARYPEDAYPFKSLWINGRSVSLENIISRKETAASGFEESTFAFIRSWLSGEEKFELTTSGSTGLPKTIFITRAQMIVSARRTSEKIGLLKGSSALVCIDTRYIGGKMMLVRSLTLGLYIVALDPSANPLIRIPVDKCVQFTALVPYQIHEILESKHPHLLNNFDNVLIGGAPLSTSLRERLGNLQAACYETYGMTETVSHVALRLVNTSMKQPYFKRLPGINISKDPRGCLVISADYLPAPVVTNDLVDLITPEEFVWLGRWDRVINSGGVKVSPEKVEQHLTAIFNTHNLQYPFFIAALPDERLGNKIVLVLEGVQFSSELPERILPALRSSLSPYEFPREVYTTPCFVFTPSQKIDQPQTLAGATFFAALK
jgi:O-succinylbenzoic acid--CoA ligase